MERGVMAAPLTEQDVRAVLNTIVDPCSRVAGAPAGLVDMGLIRRLALVPSAGSLAPSAGSLVLSPGRTDVHVVIGVTEYACLMGPAFATEAYKKLTALPGTGEVLVELDGEFDWDPDDMSPEYRRHLASRHRQGHAYFLALRDLTRPGADAADRALDRALGRGRCLARPATRHPMRKRRGNSLATRP
jgi:metal-sulfur cluster biosynthetic enzyme